MSRGTVPIGGGVWALGDAVSRRFWDTGVVGVGGVFSGVWGGCSSGFRFGEGWVSGWRGGSFLGGRGGLALACLTASGKSFTRARIAAARARRSSVSAWRSASLVTLAALGFGVLLFAFQFLDSFLKIFGALFPPLGAGL